MNYAIWQACERFGLLPPGVKRRWDDNDPWTQAQLIAYSHVCDHDEMEVLGGTSNPTAAAARRK